MLHLARHAVAPPRIIRDSKSERGSEKDGEFFPATARGHDLSGWEFDQGVQIQPPSSPLADASAQQRRLRSFWEQISVDHVCFAPSL